jgi:hypothetical protein
MRTDDLIEALSMDSASPPTSLSRVWRLALLAGIVTSGGALLATLHLRPDLSTALGTARVLFKFVATLTLALPAGLLVRHLADPSAPIGGRLRLLLLAPLAVLVAVILELSSVPESGWWPRMVGNYARWCVACIPAFSLPVLAALFYALRRGAPVQPRLTGLLAGLTAGGLGGAIYALHCPDDSPLFVAVWYTLGIALVGALGAALGPRLLRW